MQDPPVYTSGTYISSSARTPLPTTPRLAPRPLVPASHRHPAPAPTKPNFVSAALRVPADYEKVLVALKKHDEAESVKRLLGSVTVIGPSAGRYLESLRSRKVGVEVEEEEVVAKEEETEVVAAKKKSKKKGKAKKKKAEVDEVVKEVMEEVVNEHDEHEPLKLHRSLTSADQLLDPSITVNLPISIPAHVHPMTPIVNPVEPAEAPAELEPVESAKLTIDTSIAPCSPELKTPEDTLTINVESVSPTPTETDGEESLDSPKIVGLGGLPFGRNDPEPHPYTLTSTPLTTEPLPYSPKLSPSLPPNRHLSPAPTLPGSPLRNEILPFSPSPSDCATAKPWSLYFSDTDKTRSSARTPAETYSDNLVPIFTADNLLDLFGRWKALRRQIANATRRPIEPPHTDIAPGQMGIGLHYMSDDNNFHFFVEGVKPMWEDPMCAKGGKFMFAGRGEMPPGSQVVGITLSRRSTNVRLEVWLGGSVAPDMGWIRRVQEAFTAETRREVVFVNGAAVERMGMGLKVFEYQAFHGPQARRKEAPRQAQGRAPMVQGIGLGLGLGPRVPIARSMSMM